MLGRLIASYSRHFRHLSTSLSPCYHPPPPFLSPHIPKPLSSSSSSHFTPRPFSTNNNDNGEKPTSDIWKMGQEDPHLDDIFDTHHVPQQPQPQHDESWEVSDSLDSKGGLFEAEAEAGGGGYSPMAELEEWKLGKEENLEDLFGIEVGVSEGPTHKEIEMVSDAQKLVLENEQTALLDVLQGPNRAFGDLVAQSGITDEMLDSLIALKNFQDIEGLPPLTQIEDERYETTTRKSSRYEMELQKQEEAAKARVRQVDEKGRAYGTGKRKCSIARVWIQPGEGKFLINDKEYDVYFPMLDQRAALLRPFSETKTLGLWDVKCTVKGGGVTGQVDAIRLGISRALQNWEPGLRPPLREAGFLTRDSRIVERKKPGKAKARKSFQWVKR